MVFINTSDSIGFIISSMTENITGSEVLTLFFVILFLYLLCLLLRIPVEVSSVILFPLVFAIALYSSTFMIFLGIMGFQFAVTMLTWIFLR